MHSELSGYARCEGKSSLPARSMGSKVRSNSGIKSDEHKSAFSTTKQLDTAKFNFKRFQQISTDPIFISALVKSLHIDRRHPT